MMRRLGTALLTILSARLFEPVDFDLPFKLLEFGVTGYYRYFSQLCKGRGKAVSVSSFASGLQKGGVIAKLPIKGSAHSESECPGTPLSPVNGDMCAVDPAGPLG